MASMTDSQTVSVHSLNFGDLEIPESKVIHFNEGLPGFPQLRRFALLEQEALKPFQYLQSLDNPPIALLVINPMLVDPDYRLELAGSDMAEINATGVAELSVYAVATIPENPEQATLNLMAPIIIHESNRMGKQVILHQSRYSVKQPLFSASGKSESV
jgi:flagellar assembly factor FliW